MMKTALIFVKRYDGSIDVTNKYNGRSFIINGDKESGYAIIYDCDKKQKICITTRNYYNQEVVKRFNRIELEKELEKYY